METNSKILVSRPIRSSETLTALVPTDPVKERAVHGFIFVLERMKFFMELGFIVIHVVLKTLECFNVTLNGL